MDLLYLVRLIAFITSLFISVWAVYWATRLVISWKRGGNGLTIAMIMFIIAFAGQTLWPLMIYGAYVFGIDPRLWPLEIWPVLAINVNVFAAIAMANLHIQMGNHHEVEHSQPDSPPSEESVR